MNRWVEENADALPLRLVPLMFIVPAVPVGGTGVREVEDSTEWLVAGMVATCTAVVLPTRVPKLSTVVPPGAGPDPGVTGVNMGTAPTHGCRAEVDADATPASTIPKSKASATRILKGSQAASAGRISRLCRLRTVSPPFNRRVCLKLRAPRETRAAARNGRHPLDPQAPARESTLTTENQL